MRTAMEDLREDLLESIISGKNSLNKIQNELIRSNSIFMLELIINNIVKRIDEELLEKEKNQSVLCIKEIKK
jgi:hypothetical protein